MIYSLYDAATEALVSETSAASTFEKMIGAAFSASDPALFYKDVKETEERIKKEFEIKSMPNPWRSAKSVVYQALKLGIKLLNDNGNLMGKTALQTKIKEAKKEDKEEESLDQYVARVTRLVFNVPKHLDAVAVRKAIKEVI